MRYLLIIALFFSVDGLSAQTDTINLFEFEDFMKIVRRHHPVAKQANLQIQKGNATVMRSRGAFDPKAFSNIDQKYYDDKTYWSRIRGGLKIPTWFGVEMEAAYHENQGEFLNAENTLPEAGLFYAGISIPVGQGLFIDQRRADLKKAQVFRHSTEAQQQAMINKLLYTAGEAYWEWFRTHSDVLVYENALQLAEQRYNAVQRSAVLGDRPAMDTVEAGIQVQNRRLGLQQAQLDYKNATAKLSVFLWADGTIPLELAVDAVPHNPWEMDPMPVDPDLAAQMDTLIANHPELRTYELKIDGLEVDKRLKQEQLKPQLDLKYNALNEPLSGNPLAQYSVNNYRWGLQFNMPILLRRERGEVQLAEIQIQEAGLDLQSKNATLHYQARVALNEWSTTVDQVVLYRKTVRDYERLVNGERQMFDAGESSLFLVNRRELGYINAQVKRNALLAKNRKAGLAAKYAFGLLGR